MKEKPVDLASDDPVWRRYGRDHDKPCADPNVLTCALWRCQKADRCQKMAVPAHPGARP